MKLTIDIPDEFVTHYEFDGFEDSLHRLSADAHLLAGNYEQETAKMLIKAFQNATPSKYAKWKMVPGYCTPGGDPVWCCSRCGKGKHVYGIEHGTYGADVSDGQWVACPNCGAEMDGEEYG